MRDWTTCRTRVLELAAFLVTDMRLVSLGYGRFFVITGGTEAGDTDGCGGGGTGCGWEREVPAGCLGVHRLGLVLLEALLVGACGCGRGRCRCSSRKGASDRLWHWLMLSSRCDRRMAARSKAVGNADRTAENGEDKAARASKRGSNGLRHGCRAGGLAVDGADAEADAEADANVEAGAGAEEEGKGTGDGD